MFSLDITEISPLKCWFSQGRHRRKFLQVSSKVRGCHGAYSLMFAISFCSTEFNHLMACSEFLYFISIAGSFRFGRDVRRFSVIYYMIGFPLLINYVFCLVFIWFAAVSKSLAYFRSKKPVGSRQRGQVRARGILTQQMGRSHSRSINRLRLLKFWIVS